MKTKIEKTKIIGDIMSRMPETRVDMNKLISTYWRMENPMTCKFGNADRFLREFANGEFTMPETIIRIARRLQMKQPELSRAGLNFIDKRKKQTS